MAVRNVQEILASVKDLVGDKEGVETLLEDITDSYTTDLSQYVKKSEYDQARSEADKAIETANNYRDKYINRFYSNYNEPNSKGFIDSGTTQGDIEKEESWGDYTNLFE